MGASSRERLHRLIDTLPEHELEAAERLLEALWPWEAGAGGETATARAASVAADAAAGRRAASRPRGLR